MTLTTRSRQSIRKSNFGPFIPMMKGKSDIQERLKRAHVEKGWTVCTNGVSMCVQQTLPGVQPGSYAFADGRFADTPSDMGHYVDWRSVFDPEKHIGDVFTTVINAGLLLSAIKAIGTHSADRSENPIARVYVGDDGRIRLERESPIEGGIYSASAGAMAVECKTLIHDFNLVYLQNTVRFLCGEMTSRLLNWKMQSPKGPLVLRSSLGFAVIMPDYTMAR